MIDSVKLGDTIYVPIKIDRITSIEENEREKVTCYGGFLECTQPGNGERQKILVFFDNDYILDNCRVESAVAYT